MNEPVADQQYAQVKDVARQIAVLDADIATLQTQLDSKKTARQTLQDQARDLMQAVQAELGLRRNQQQ